MISILFIGSNKSSKTYKSIFLEISASTKTIKLVISYITAFQVVRKLVSTTLLTIILDYGLNN